MDKYDALDNKTINDLIEVMNNKDELLAMVNNIATIQYHTGYDDGRLFGYDEGYDDCLQYGKYDHE